MSCCWSMLWSCILNNLLLPDTNLYLPKRGKELQAQLGQDSWRISRMINMWDSVFTFPIQQINEQGNNLKTAYFNGRYKGKLVPQDPEWRNHHQYLNGLGRKGPVGQRRKSKKSDKNLNPLSGRWGQFLLWEAAREVSALTRETLPEIPKVWAVQAREAKW